MYLALSCGCPLAGALFTKYSVKHVMFCAMFLNVLSLVGFSLTPSGWPNTLILARAAIGFSQAFISVYAPVWVDEFATAGSATSWMSALQASVPIGVMIGYVMGAASTWVESCPAGIDCWRFPFFTQAFFLLPASVAILFVPAGHIDTCELSEEERRDLLEAREAPAFASLPAESDHSSNGYDGMASLPVVREASNHSATGSEGDSSPPIDVSASSGAWPASSSPATTGYGATEVAVAPAVTTRSSSSSYGQLPAVRSTGLGVQGGRRGSGGVRKRGRASTAGAVGLGVTHERSEAIAELRSLQQFNRRLSFSGLDAVDGMAAFAPQSLTFTSEALAEGRRRRRGESAHGVAMSPPAPSDPPRRLSPVPVTTSAPSGRPSPTAASPPVDAAVRPRRRSSSVSTMAQVRPRVRSSFAYEKVSEAGLCHDLMSLLNLPVFWCVVFALSGLYFVVTGVQFWATDYLITVIKAEAAQVELLFIITSATGPVLGVFFGGWVVDKFGGYRGRRQAVVALTIDCMLGGLALACAVPVTFIDNVWAVCGCLWGLLFFGGAVLPSATGIYIAAVPLSMRALASSVSVVLFNLLGYFLSPFVSGWLMGEFSYRWGFRVCLLWSGFPVLLMLTGLVFATFAKSSKSFSSKSPLKLAVNGTPEERRSLLAHEGASSANIDTRGGGLPTIAASADEPSTAARSLGDVAGDIP